MGVKPDDVVVSVGDVLDRGEENLKCVREFTQKENRYMVLGNHDDMLIKGVYDQRWGQCWLANGGITTLK